MARKILFKYFIGALWLSFSNSFSFAVYQLFLYSFDLSLLQINLVNLAFMISVFLLEIPTGAFADSFGRGKSVALGAFITALGFTIYFLSGIFYLFLLAEIVVALGVCFMSGAMEAWMVDTLRDSGWNKDLRPIYQKEAGFNLIGIMSGASLGAWAGNSDLSLPWLLTAIGMMIFAFYSYFVFKDQSSKSKKISLSLAPIKKVAKESLHYGFRHKEIFSVIVFSSILTISFQAFNMQWNLLLSTHNVEVFKMGWIFAGISLALYLGSQVAVFLAKPFKSEKLSIVFLQLITALAMILAASFASLLGILSFFLLHEFG
ncbi:MAG: hypothetical protein K9M44_00530 [Candidatus Pacebacteria bacterium]|nr:hypothetical protein [Candidatus Paceibacterota bacterium]